jgi:hypothetical protein
MTMARIYVTNDTLSIRVEIVGDGDSGHEAECDHCGFNLVANTHEQWNFEDTVQVAELHVDRYTAAANQGR